MIFDGLTVSGLRRYKCEKCNKLTYTDYEANYCACCGHFEPLSQTASYKERLTSFILQKNKKEERR